MKTLGIDIETFSSADLKKAGVYKYSESPDFEILLFGYSVDGGEVQVVDFTAGEKLPEEIIQGLTNPGVTKWAFNSQFERICLSRWLGVQYLDPRPWRCTMVWSAYMGLPLSLEGVGAVLGLEKQKLTEGKDLIRYFCTPCKPTMANGQRTRNLPIHDPAKWEQFKAYNCRDVEVEIAIQERLAKYPVPEGIWDEFHLDQEINDRGVALDMTLVQAAIKADELTRSELLERMGELTDLDNPNSVQQLKEWLADQGLETDTLGKKAVAELLETAPKPLDEVLQLRQQLAKSSVKKYQAMENVACLDNRTRGIFQFYGANRTGRWCLTGDHEVLTKDGWQRLDEWGGGEIACWNPKGEIVSFQKSEKVQFNYDGYLYHYFDKRISQISTPEHKMYVKRHYGGVWQTDIVENMATYRPSIPFTGFRTVNSSLEHQQLRVLIMVQGDGHYVPDGGIKLKFVKLRKIERCRCLLRRAEITYTETKQKAGHKMASLFTINARHVPLWLRLFRKKTFGSWLFDESPDVFFDELVHWDGYQSAKNSIQYSTTNKKNADMVQAFAHLSGRSALIRTKDRSDKNWSTYYVVDIWLTPKNCHEIKTKPQMQHYTGRVYCAVTSTGYFLVRRDGKVWVTGNSGRLLQPQNLPRNSMPDLAQARGLVRSGNFTALEMLYDSVPEVLSQLIRTAFIPKPGYKFIVADFSSIERVVLAWLAREQWVLDAYAAKKDLYIATASQMFGVPITDKKDPLRQKGKIADLACIAEGQSVLTDAGLVPIEEITTEYKVWDGRQWVTHDGLVCQGQRETVNVDGVICTPDHLILTNQGWVESGKSNGHYWAGVYRPRSAMQALSPTPAGLKPVYDLMNCGSWHRFAVWNGRRLCLVHNCGYGGSVGAIKAMGALEMGLTEEELKPLVDAWRAANPNIVRFWWDVDRAALTAVRERTTTETHGIRFAYQSGMLFITLPSGRRLAYVKPRIGTNHFGSDSVTYEGIGAAKKWERLETYGAKIVENIIQAISRDLLCYAMQNLRHLPIVMHIHDEIVIEAEQQMSVRTVCEQMSQIPPWAKGLLLRAEGFECDFYQKD